jgi:hypothetical protein
MDPPDSTSRGELVDLLDRILDRGVVIQADLIVSLAGVPLIGLNLRAALAGMETMIDYGLMGQWDRKIRAEELDRHSSRPPLRVLDAPANRN